MTRTDQKAFINQFVSNVRGALLDQLPTTPETWDREELRNWIAGMFRATAELANEGEAEERGEVTAEPVSDTINLAAALKSTQRPDGQE